MSAGSIGECEKTLHFRKETPAVGSHAAWRVFQQGTPFLQTRHALLAETTRCVYRLDRSFFEENHALFDNNTEQINTLFASHTKR